MEIILSLLLVIFLVLLNGFFVASEFALVGVRKTRINELAKKGSNSAKLVKKSLDDLDSYISATQLGITLASLALGWVGEPAIARFIEPLFTFLPHTMQIITAHTLSVAIAFTIITFLHIVLGELAPKTIALQRSEKTSLAIITPLRLFTRVFKPFIWVLNGAGNLVLRIIGMHAPDGHHLVHSEEEIKMILSQSAASGAIASKEAEMVYSVFGLGDIPVRQIMVPRTEMLAFNIATTLEKIIKKIERHPHSRFPVYEHSMDTIVGFVHIKDVYKALLKNGGKTKLSETKIIREIISVPESKRIDDVLLDMRKQRIHITIINDEFGGTAGMATLEDIIESLVGEIHDEFEQPIHDIQKQDNGSFIIDGLTPIDRVKKYLHIPIQGQGYTTIGGLVFGLLGHQPVTGDIVQIGDLTIEIISMDKRRIEQVKISVPKKRKKR